MNNHNLSLLLKIDSEDIFAFFAYDGYLELCNLSKVIKIKINFESYELFFEVFIEIFKVLLGNKEVEINVDYVIKNDSETTIVWTPYSLPDGNKAIILKGIFKNNAASIFEVNLHLESFVSLVQGYSSTILSTLLLKEDEKLLFQNILSSSFDWSVFDGQSFNDDYFINFAKNYKQRLDLQIDISNIYYLFKTYFPILTLLQKTNGLICIQLIENIDITACEPEPNLQDVSSL